MRSLLVLSALLVALAAAEDNLVLDVFKNTILGGKEEAAAPKERTSVKVIGAGYGRTGTNSLQEALEILGFKTYHMKYLIEHDDADAWRAWMETGNFDSVADVLELGGYTATTDDPACSAYKELMARYPEGKVILTYRTDLDKWIKSLTVLMDVAAVMTSYPIKYIPSFARWGKMFKVYWGTFRDCTFPITEESMPRCIQNYHNHIDEVKRIVPQDKLLVFTVTDGWGPLCEFLGVPVPDVPFPRTNSSAEMERAVLIIRTAVVSAHILLAAVVLFLIRKFIAKRKSSDEVGSLGKAKKSI